MISKNGIQLNSPIGINPDFLLSVSMGNVPGTSMINKFGQNNDLANGGGMEDIWDLGGTYVYPTDATAPITDIISTQAGDTQDIEVQGLDINCNLVIQTKTLTGITKATLDTPLWRIFRLKNVGTTDNIGIITAEDTTLTTTYAAIAIGNNQTLMALYTIPNGYTGFLYQMGISLVGSSKDYTIDGEMRMRPYGGVFQLKTTFGIIATGTSSIQRSQPLYVKIGEKTDIRVRAESVGAIGALNSTFDILLLENAVWGL